MKKLLTAMAAVIMAVAIPSASLAAPPSTGGFTLFGDATLVSPGNNSATAAQASYDGISSFGGVNFAVPSGLTVSQLTNLSTDYQFTVGSCQGGAPRLVAAVTNGTKSGNINFYIGPPPSYTGCPANTWTNSGNLASPTNLVDDSQIGGTFYDPYANTQATFGSYTVTGISVVVDGFQPTPLTAQFDNVAINNSLTTFETKDSCKNGGWQQFTGSPGPFKNQGDCVSYFENGK